MDETTQKRKRGRPKKIERPPGRRGVMLGEKHKKKGMCLRRYIYTVFKYTDKSMSVKKSTMEAMNAVVIDVMKNVCREAALLCEHSKNKVLGHVAIDSATRMIFPGMLAQYALHCGQEAVEKYKALK